MPRTVVCGAVVMVLDMLVVVVQDIVIRIGPNVGYWRGSGVVAGAAARPLLAVRVAVAEVGRRADRAGRPRQRSVERRGQQLCGVGRPHGHDRRAAADPGKGRVPSQDKHDSII